MNHNNETNKRNNNGDYCTHGNTADEWTERAEACNSRHREARQT